MSSANSTLKSNSIVRLPQGWLASHGFRSTRHRCVSLGLKLSGINMIDIIIYHSKRDFHQHHKKAVAQKNAMFKCMTGLMEDERYRWKKETFISETSFLSVNPKSAIETVRVKRRENLGHWDDPSSLSKVVSNSLSHFLSLSVAHGRNRANRRGFIFDRLPYRRWACFITFLRLDEWADWILHQTEVESLISPQTRISKVRRRPVG
ncbi:predicted protein [Sclerotinia sclerotiorum 1980 UF-70]|uniref:Uncharacterized protein n=1 Tax=Sclerotinia sclerotiorum (strain ATCC 18683 / 1980 / Ss-1) TaxID=665079 RepID=A7EAU5_SCLS1|nr:predicted protein [Sclerotinia sclerotiorum 1980 UF-70]EDN99573.1 predicted protein [Sclerotinia sclerotiorum 1980 UF-70]